MPTARSTRRRYMCCRSTWTRRWRGCTWAASALTSPISRRSRPSTSAWISTGRTSLSITATEGRRQGASRPPAPIRTSHPAYGAHHGRELSRPHLAQRQDQALGGGHHPRDGARAPLRLLHLRGHPQLRDAQGADDLPPLGPHAAVLQLRQGL